jgi:shikimate dehydrogenase
LAVISGSTRLAAVIGMPVRHSLSPAIHNAAFRSAGVDWVYVALPVEPGDVPDALAGMRALGIGGLNVTMPHKEAVHHAMDVLDPVAAALRTVNTVVPLSDGRLSGHTTDGAGFLDALRIDEGVDVAGMRVVVLGAGGAARAVVDALARAGAAQVIVVNRSPDNAASAAALAGSVGRTGAMTDVAAADLVVNATPIGMGTDATPVDPASLRAGQIVVDLVYHPLDTALLQAARAAGARAVDGLGMLVHQAAHSFRLWTGVDAPVTVMRDAALAELAARTASARSQLA